MNQEPEKTFRAFVLMPFDLEFNAVYTDLVKPALEEVGYDVKRADSILNQHNILKDIVRGIAEADLVVADLTSLNANVFYELGVSHAMKKPTVLLSQSSEDIPFDLKPYRVILYSTHFNEAPQLSQKLKEIGEKAKSGKLGFGNPVTDFLPQMSGVKFHPVTKDERAVIETEGERKIETGEEEKGIWDFIVDSEKSMKNIAECMKRMTKAMQEIGKKMQQRAAEVQKIKKSGLPGTALQVRKITTAAAMDMIQHAKIFEEEQPKLHNAWESFDENTSGLVQTARIHTKEDKDAFLKYRSSVDELQSKIRNASKGVQGYRKSVVGLRGISRDINRASKRTAHILDLLISDLEGADSYCAKVLTLLDEKIEKGD
jgi:uncharacterized coiled-coil DUF342 family protein